MMPAHRPSRRSSALAPPLPLLRTASRTLTASSASLSSLYRREHEPREILVPESDNGGGYSDLAGRPHQHLLVSVARAMGLDTNQIGLDHVQGQTGVRVDCSGPLPELTGRRRSP